MALLEAARCQRAAPDRISFMDALRWVRDPKADTILNFLLVISNRPNQTEAKRTASYQTARETFQTLE